MGTKIGILVLVLLLVASSASAQEKGAEVRITLERTACFGMCPVYSVTIYDDGTVIYEGERFTDVTGTQTVNIGADAVAMLVEVFENAGYFEWEDAYTDHMVTDQPSAITSVSHAGETKRITHYMGDDTAPVALTYLENWIDLSIQSEQWTGTEPSLPLFTTAGPAIITLERTYCFGTCPVYRLAIHEDGTVVYMGLDHVAETGIHVAQIEAQALRTLAAEIAAQGYFDLVDEYVDYQITDLPYATTSLQWDGQSKLIRHYHGDEKAPETLTEIENQIDAAVNIEQWTIASDPLGTEEAPDGS